MATDAPSLDTSTRHFHANPVFLLQEVETAKRLAGELHALGFEVTPGVGKTGGEAVLRNSAGPTLLALADIDTLPAAVLA